MNVRNYFFPFPDFHGYDGPLVVSPGRPSLLGEAFVNGGEEIGFERMEYLGQKHAGLNHSLVKILP